MGVETKIYSLLSGSTVISAVCGSRIYPNIAPQEPTFPFITYTVIDRIKQNTLGGYAGLENPRVQIDVWGKTYAAVLDLSTRVATVMQGAADFKALLITDNDLTEPSEDGDIWYRQSKDFSIWNKEA